MQQKDTSDKTCTGMMKEMRASDIYKRITDEATINWLKNGKCIRLIEETIKPKKTFLNLFSEDNVSPTLIHPEVYNLFYGHEISINNERVHYYKDPTKLAYLIPKYGYFKVKAHVESYKKANCMCNFNDDYIIERNNDEPISPIINNIPATVKPYSQIVSELRESIISDKKTEEYYFSDKLEDSGDSEHTCNKIAHDYKFLEENIYPKSKYLPEDMFI